MKNAIFRLPQQIATLGLIVIFILVDFRHLSSGQNVKLSLTGYVLFLVLTVTVCVLFQERFVVRVKKWLVARFIDHPAKPVGETGVKTSR